MSNIVVKGTAFWSSLSRPNQLNDKYTVDIGHLDGDTVAAIKATGAKVTAWSRNLEKTEDKDPDKGNFVTVQSKYPPTIKDGAGTLIQSKVNDEVVLAPFNIGNGSILKLKCHAFDWTFKAKKGTSLGSNEIMILKLIAFEDDSLEPEENAYVLGDDVETVSNAGDDVVGGEASAGANLEVVELD
jgi:hypothetical protein